LVCFFKILYEHPLEHLSMIYFGVYSCFHNLPQLLLVIVVVYFEIVVKKTASLVIVQQIVALLAKE
jgi:hypothetical protein